MLNREREYLNSQIAFDKTERLILEKYHKRMATPKTLQDYMVRLAKLGGYLARKSDAPPDHTVIWRSLNKLYALRASMELANFVGN